MTRWSVPALAAAFILGARASAAARHLASLGKSRNAVVVPTPPVDVPLTTNVTRIKVHIGYPSLLGTASSARYNR